MKKISKIFLILGTTLLIGIGMFYFYKNIAQAGTNNKYVPEAKNDVVTFDESIFDNK